MIFVRPIGSISCVRVAAATLALSPMAPKRRRLSSKASAQAHRNKVCNRNRRKRRDALGKLNQLTTDLDLPIPKLNVRLPGLPPGMTKVLRTLNKRCVGKEDAKRFEEAVRAWTTSGGALPDGMTLTDAGRVVCASDEPDPSLVPRHKLLKVSFSSQPISEVSAANKIIVFFMA